MISFLPYVHAGGVVVVNVVDEAVVVDATLDVEFARTAD